ncbi:ArfGap-domain-containing protein, partial [Aureobasidium melanogenum]
MGTHISKVKSLSMDSWSPDQVDNMKRVGNVTSNRTFNPQNVKPDIPTDADEVGGVMERFIRQKYEHKAFVGPRPRSHTVGGTSVSSNESVPPPLPPKPGKKFGFSLGVRSSSATQQRFTPPLSPALTGSDGRSTPPIGKMNKPSRVFGSNVGNQEEETFDTKLASLREMGFPDTRRNSMVLKNVNGNLDKAVETLVRLGDTTSGAQGTLTPMSGSTSSSNANGIFIEKQRAQPEKAASTNPFDALDLQPPRRAFTQPALSTAAPQPSYNPFLQPQPQPQAQPQAQAQQALQTSFSAMQISGQQPQQYQNNPFMPQQMQQPLQAPAYQPQETQQYQQPQPQSNPFLRKTQSQTFAPSNPFGIQLSAAPQNPWLAQPQVQTPQAQSPGAFYQPQQDFFSAQPQPQQQPQYQQQPQQSQPQQNLYQQPPQQLVPQHTSNPYANMPLQPASNPFQVPQSSQPEPYQSYQSAQQQMPQQQQQLFSQPSGRYGKTDIMALYNQPQLAPPRPLQPLPENGMAPPMMPQQQQQQAQVPPHMQQGPQRSVTMPVGSGSMNPFGSGFSAPQQDQQARPGARHVSQESRDFVGMGNGRPHSPDAFASLSARYAR